MTASIESVERTVHVTNRWLHELAAELGGDEQHAYQTLRAVLHALRDRLSVDEAAQLAAQLPELLRGVFYEGWVPARTPETYRDADTFLRHVAVQLRLHGTTEASYATQAVMTVLRRHVSEGELRDVMAVVPASVRTLLAARAGDEHT